MTHEGSAVLLMNTLIEGLATVFSGLLRISGQATVLILLLWVVQTVLGRKLTPRWRHTLWLLVVVRLLVPLSIPSPVSVFNLVHKLAGTLRNEVRLEGPGSLNESASVRPRHQTASPEPGAVSSVLATNTARSAVSSLMPGGSAGFLTVTWNWPRRLALVWLGIGLMLGLRLLVQNARFHRRLIRDGIAADADLQAILQRVGQEMGLRRVPPLLQTHQIPSPGLYGLWRPRLLIPSTLRSAFSETELRYIFLHELAHLKRGDMIVNWLTTMAQVLHWFNPLVWLAFHRLRSDREVAADALALSHLEARETRTYGHTILKMLENLLVPAPLPGWVGVLEEKIQMKRRIDMIAKYKHTNRWPVLAMAAFSSLALIALTDAKSEPEKADAAETKRSGDDSSSITTGIREDNSVILDQKTGIRFTKFKTISGSNDVISGSGGLDLSPNGKFLLWGGDARVVPLDGSALFDLVNMPGANSGSWSPDGRKVIFHDKGIWLIDVDPETGRPAGSPRKLLEQEDRALGPPVWSSDSKRIIFRRFDRQVQDQIWALSIENGDLSPVADPFSLGIVSPDGKMVACSEGQGIRNQNSLLVKPVAGGEARKLMDRVYPVVWSTDSEWLVCKPGVGGGWVDNIRFVRVADGREVMISTPGVMIRRSPQGRKLLFYHMSYDYQNVLKVISVAGGPPAKLGGPSMSFGGCTGYQSWTRDARSILVDKGGDRGLWVVPLDGKDPQSLTIDIPLRPGDSSLFSPDNGKLLLIRDTRTEAEAQKAPTSDLWVVPISPSQKRSTGPEVKVFGGGRLPSSYWSCDPPAWSPDGKKIAFSHKMDIWVASADGKSSAQLTETSELDRWPDWSPDGTMIAFGSQSPPYTNTLIRVVPASGGPARVITNIHFRYSDPRFYAWSPDGKALTIASEPEGIISSFPISGGDARTVLRVKDRGIDRVGRLRWSPDGRLLGFLGTEGGKDKLYIYHLDNAKLDRFDGCDTPWYWSPDNQWISYIAEDEEVKTRPEGVLWELDVEESLAKIRQ